MFPNSTKFSLKNLKSRLKGSDSFKGEEESSWPGQVINLADCCKNIFPSGLYTHIVCRILRGGDGDMWINSLKDYAIE